MLLIKKNINGISSLNISNAEVTVGTEEGSGVQCFDLIAGKNEVVGTVCVTANHSEICCDRIEQVLEI